MKNRFAGLMAAAGLAAMAAWWMPAPAAGQAAKGKAAYKAPRAEDGKADLQGIWIVEAWNTARYNLEYHNGATGIRPGKSYITNPANGMIPYTPAFRAKAKDNFKKRFTEDPVNKCFMTGVPRFVYSGYPFQIFQTSKYIIMASEYVHMLRYIYMDRKAHLDGVDFWLGDSLGRWEGDTLVIDTRNHNDMTWLDASGNAHSDKLTVIERLTRTGPDTMLYSATLTDPEAYTMPWTITLNLVRNTDQYAQLMEYECHAYKEQDEGRAGGQVDSQ
jgi:hypothetical protein